jgi:RNA polymerase sigma-70 factor, ECF subfamily
VVALNRAVAVAQVSGPAGALALVESLPLERYHLYHSVRGNLLTRLGRAAEAGTAYEKALVRATTDAERTLLRGLLD